MSLLKFKRTDGGTLGSDVETAVEGKNTGTAGESLFGTDLRDVGRVVLLGEMGQDEMSRLGVENL